MKTTKMSLATMQGKMSRSEMKMLVGGLEDTLGGDGDNKCNVGCSSNKDCDTKCPSCEKATWGEQKYCFTK